jgi:hypothetical protein
MTSPQREGRRDDSGTVTVFVVSLTAALILVAGLVYDGGRMIAAARDSDAVAAAAARAGSQGLDEAGLRETDGAPLDAAAVNARVRQFLAATAYTGSATVVGDTVTVTVHRTESLPILSLAGLRTSTVHGTGTARAVRSVTDAP